MNKLNTRQWIVGGLLLGAVFMVYENVVKPMFGDSIEQSAQIVSSPSDAASGLSLISDSRGELSEPLLGAARAVNTASLSYSFKEQRDPFTFPQSEMQAVRKYRKTSRRLAVRKAVIKNRPELTAVMLGSVQKFALVDGEVVSEGETVNGVRVVKIVEDTVFFEGRDGEFSLKLTTAQIGKSYE